MDLTVMIVDDSPTTRCIIEGSIRRADANVKTVLHASNGREALCVLNRELVHLVIMDIHMPEMSGRELLKLMRKNALWRDTPVAVISSERSDATEIELAGLGVSEYFKKPLSDESIREMLQTLKGQIA